MEGGLVEREGAEVGRAVGGEDGAWEGGDERVQPLVVDFLFGGGVVGLGDDGEVEGREAGEDGLDGWGGEEAGSGGGGGGGVEEVVEVERGEGGEGGEGGEEGGEEGVAVGRVLRPFEVPAAVAFGGVVPGAGAVRGEAEGGAG